MSKTAKIIVLSIVGALLCAVLVWGIVIRNVVFIPFGPYFGGVERSSTEVTKQSEFEADAQGIQSIYLDLISERIDVVATNDSKIRVEETSNTILRQEDIMQCSVNNGTLLVSSGLRDNNWLSWTTFGDIRVTLYLPASYQNNIGLHTVSGEISAQDLRAAELKIDSTSGTIKATNIQANTANMSSISGEMTLRDVSSGSIDMHETSGNIRLKGGSFDKVAAHSTSGEIALEAQKMGSIDAGSTSGTVNASVDEMPAKISVGTVSGEVTLELPENDGFTLKTNTVSGDVNNDFAVAHGVYKEGGQNSIEVGTTSGSITIIKK